MSMDAITGKARARVHGLVTRGRIYGDGWGVHVDMPTGGYFNVDDIPALLEAIQGVALLARQENERERRIASYRR